MRRWGVRTVSLVLTALGLYIVAPGLLALFGSWPRLRDVEPWWFVVLIVLVGGSMASMWWLTRLALRSPTARRTGAIRRSPGAPQRPPTWPGTRPARSSPGGPATAGVVQAKVLIDAGEPPAAVASAMTAMGLLTTGVLLLLPSSPSRRC